MQDRIQESRMGGETVQISGEELSQIKGWNRSKLELELTRNLARDLTRRNSHETPLPGGPGTGKDLLQYRQERR